MKRDNADSHLEQCIFLKELNSRYKFSYDALTNTGFLSPIDKLKKKAFSGVIDSHANRYRAFSEVFLENFLDETSQIRSELEKSIARTTRGLQSPPDEQKLIEEYISQLYKSTHIIEGIQNKLNFALHRDKESSRLKFPFYCDSFQTIADNAKLFPWIGASLQRHSNLTAYQNTKCEEIKCNGRELLHTLDLYGREHLLEAYRN